MATVNANIGTRATLALSATSYEATLQIKGLRFTGSERAAIDSSHMGTADMSDATTQLGNRTYIAGELISPGQLVADCWLNTNFAPPYYGATTVPNVTITVTLPGGDTPGTWVGTGFLVSFESSIPEEEMMTATLTFQFTGAITVTTSS